MLTLAIKSEATDATGAERIAELEDAMARVLRYNADILSPQPVRESHVDSRPPMNSDSPFGPAGLVALIAEARHQGKHLWNRYSGVCFTPDQLERQNAMGRFLWGAVNWELVDPGTKADYFGEPPAPADEDAGPAGPAGDESPTEDVVDGVTALLRALADPDKSFSTDRALFPAKIQDAVNFKDVPKHLNAGCGVLLKTAAGNFEIHISRAVAAKE